MRIAETLRFIKVVKRLQANQKRDLDEAVRAVAENPAMGDRKAGDLAWVRVYKFRRLKRADGSCEHSYAANLRWRALSANPHGVKVAKDCAVDSCPVVDGHGACTLESDERSIGVP